MFIYRSKIVIVLSFTYCTLYNKCQVKKVLNMNCFFLKFFYKILYLKSSYTYMLFRKIDFFLVFTPYSCNDMILNK